MHETTKDTLGMSRAARNWVDRRSKIDHVGLIGSIPTRARSNGGGCVYPYTSL